MTQFQAGFGQADITPALGCRLMGYGNRSSGATAVHDRLLARALVVAAGDERWALVSCELCYLNAATIGEARTAIEKQTGIAPDHVFLATTHTHSGPHDREAENWSRPLAELIADAVATAAAKLQPAQIASGFGMLYGYSINRRWIDRPVDPAVAVIRIDDAGGRPLGLVANYACHAVVMGPDNLHISADWPGHACARLEAELGNDATCIFLQGGAGNINPLVEGVRQQLRTAPTVVSIGNISAYYGSAGDPARYNIGDRTGGTFAEVAELGEAFAGEVLRIYRGLKPAPPAQSPWSRQVVIQAIAASDEPKADPSPLAPSVADYDALYAAGLPAEIMLLGLDDALLVGQPGEVFSETSVRLRTWLRTLGYDTPMLVSYANGWISYLPEPEDFPEGGYEVGRANGVGNSRYFQNRFREAVASVVDKT
jgi:neutral ceramidase